MASGKEKSAQPLSLARLFEPPEGFRGHFGWICGYSADSTFLDLAAEFFTRLSPARRAHAGVVTLVAMLDPGNEQIQPVEVPGVLHLPYRERGAISFRLLHAKVALLGFASESSEAPGLLRLIVSTGNWTRQSLEKNLDLAWHTDINIGRLAERNAEIRQGCADIKAAWHFLQALADSFDLHGLKLTAEGRPTETAAAMELVEEWIRRAVDSAGTVTPQFFDNREKSMIDQLPHMIERIGGATCNCLAMGSGFFEGAGEGKSGQVPSVLARIVDELRRKRRFGRLLTSRSEVHVFVNPEACQAVAPSIAAMNKEGWEIRPPHVPESLGRGLRFLHAKFLFGAFWRADSKKCLSAWLYMGSANLTAPGFLRASGAGNLEAGVVVNVPDVTWDSVSNVLPVQWKVKLDAERNKLEPGEDWDGRPSSFHAPPVSFFHAVEVNEKVWLRSKGETGIPFEVMDLSGAPCGANEELGIPWSGPVPRQVSVGWIDSASRQARRCAVPVLDAFGRVAATPLRAIDLDAAWCQLASFPLPPPDDEVIEVDHAESGLTAVDIRTSTSAYQDRSYPIRALMTLVENIAALQSGLGRHDWLTWCIRLEQTLQLSSTCEIVSETRKLGMNLLAPLKHPSFRPEFAAIRGSPEATLYEALLDRIEKCWGLDQLPVIGSGP